MSRCTFVFDYSSLLFSHFILGLSHFKDRVPMLQSYQINCCFFIRKKNNKKQYLHFIYITHCKFPHRNLMPTPATITMLFCSFTHRRRKRRASPPPPPPNNVRGGWGNIPFGPPLPNNPPTFFFNFHVKQEKITNVPS